MGSPGDRRGAVLSGRGGADVSEVEGRYFDRLLREKGEFDPFSPRGWQAIAAGFDALVPGATLPRVLDVGCGTGQSRQVYAARTGRYVGIDLSFSALAAARRKEPAARWMRADATRVPFPDASMDLVAFSSVLHHIPDPGPALCEAMRILKPGGYAFAFDPNLLHPAMALFRWPKSPFYIAEGVSPNESPLLPGTLRRAFGAAGFESIRQRCRSGVAYREVAPRVLNALLRVYNAADRAFDAVGLGRWFGTFVLTCGRKPAAEPA
ncbi:MAG TPA: class I SAM-dependent methyltransferase [Thermoanaerobaculia bacterium]|nr:class I SAM-dependent methyltransferase [Thermoanaerobaculia bacterium]